MTHRLAIILLSAISCIAPMNSFAAYQFMGRTAPLQIATLYQNEYGSAFIVFTTPIDPDCGANGMYLMNLEQPPSDLQKYKMAITIAAKVAGEKVVVDYFKDPSRPMGWDRCFVHGIELNN